MINIIIINVEALSQMENNILKRLYLEKRIRYRLGIEKAMKEMCLMQLRSSWIENSRLTLFLFCIPQLSI